MAVSTMPYSRETNRIARRLILIETSGGVLMISGGMEAN